MPCKNMILDISLSELNSELQYEKEGFFTRKSSKGGKIIGSRAGNIDRNGYVHVSINKRRYLEHRLVWLYHHGYLPDNFIDHINRNPSDNRIENLRICPNNHRQNAQNTGKFSHNTSGHKGVGWSPGKGKWRAVIGVKGKSIHLGYFKDKVSAIQARKIAEKQFFEFSEED